VRSNKSPDPERFRSLAMWMIPPASGWRRKTRGSNALSRPLAVLAVILLLVGFSGLMIMKHSTDNAVLFTGIGDLHRQATYIAELSTPPVDPQRLRYVLSEFSAQLDSVVREMGRPLVVNGTRLPGQGSPASEALGNLRTRWEQDYRPTLRKALVTAGLSSSMLVQDTANTLVKDIEAINKEMRNTTQRGATYLFLVQVGLLLSGAMVTIVILLRVQHQLLEPLAHMRNWALRMRGGNYSARIPVPGHGEFAELAKDINALANELQGLTREMDRQVKSQSERLALKTRSLKILYDVAENLNASRELDQLLARFMRTLADVVGARAAVVRLLTDDGQMRLVASMGLDANLLEQDRLVPKERCLCGDAMTHRDAVGTIDVKRCTGLRIMPYLPSEDMEMVAVPLQYRDKTLGVYNLFLDQPGLTDREDIHELLISIGRHLGMAAEKSRLDSEARRLAIMQERAMLAHELHDSLAQILASLRFQVKMLEETLQKQAAGPALTELGKIREGVEEAHAELRQLLVHFRARVDERGLVPALADMIDRFRQETGINTFFHKECDQVPLGPDREVQVLHIVQEALTNVRKHSNAHTVRVLLRCERADGYRILVEDDGQGLTPNGRAPLPGERIGLSIMHERARRLGGTLRVESDAGEGTRVELTCSRTRPEPEEVLEYQEA
jgi:two-component system nitrate/nitrite sensor histidine kinase NarX